MKKLLLLLFLPFIMLTANGQDTTKKADIPAPKLTAGQVYQDAKAGFKDALNGLKELASKLEGPAKHVYNVYIYQHRARGITFLFLPVLLLGIAIFLLYRYWEKADWGDGNKACYATSIAFFAGTFFTEIINPEYYAIQDVVKIFK